MGGPEETRTSEPPRQQEPSHRRLPQLPLVVRICVLIAGWVVLLVGIAGLALPGIQGCLTIAVGAALLSLASEMIYRWLRRRLERWPKVWGRVEQTRGWMHGKLSRSGETSDASEEE